MVGCRRASLVLSVIHTVAETGSTNADMLALARSGAEEGLWLRAERQTGGRGRQGRVWDSPVGNLHASTLVRLRPADPAAATLALVAGVAVEEAVRSHLSSSPSPFRRFAPPSLPRVGRKEAAQPPMGEGDVEPYLKWPNDLLIGGAKLAGILLERADDAVVVGVGINLAHHPDLPDRRTTSLASHGADVFPVVLLDTLAEAFARWVSRWRGEGLAPVRARWLERAHPPGTPLTARLPDGRAVDGLFDGLDQDGALVLRPSTSSGRALAGDGRRVIHAGDVFLL